MMTPLERLEFCRICQNRANDMQIGLVCGLTQEKPTFEKHCPDFVTDQDQQAKLFSQEALMLLQEAYAPNQKRFFNYVIDVIGMWISGFGLGVMFALFGLEEILLSIPDQLLGIFLAVGYYLFMEGLTNQTLGKMITNTIVVKEDGSKPTFTDILLRTLARLIPFEAFSFLGKRGWHDSLTKTMVVDKKLYEKYLNMTA